MEKEKEKDRNQAHHARLRSEDKKWGISNICRWRKPQHYHDELRSFLYCLFEYLEGLE